MSTDSDTTRHQRIKALFLDALDQPEDGRTAWLHTAADGDQNIRAEVEALLAAHHEAEDSGRLEQPPFARTDDSLADPMVGRDIGPWRLLERIGTGGMGAVYRAERADGAYERTVAIKLLRPGSDVVGLAERLHAERNLLARLEHPHIARLYDGGVTDSGSGPGQAGLPYLAMEFVDGMPITGYCGTRKLDIDARIGLFLQVCDAVAYAHRNLIIHRDLKPSNILVTDADDQAGVRLLDFGIAKLLEGTGDGAVETRTGLFALTPSYAAPEQLRRQPITTATDVYGLGVVLYELLAGQRPYDLLDMTATEIEHVVCEVEPEKPSASGRNPRLQGDLDTIILKALAKEPERRYASAEALADDLNRHRSGLPVHARPATTGYRVRKFVERHKTGSIAALLVVLALVAGLGMALWQARVAESQRDVADQRFETAREMAHTLLFDIHDEIADLPGATPARELIVRRSQEYLNELAIHAADDPSLRLDLARAYQKIGDVQGNPANSNLGRIADAIDSYRNGLALLETAPEADSLSEPFLRARAVLYEKLGDVTAHTGEIDSALTYLDLAVTFFEAYLEAQQDDPNRLLSLAIEHVKRGDYTGNPNFPNAEQPLQALEHYSRSLNLLSRAGELDPEHMSVQRYVGLVYERVGTVHAEEGDETPALAAFRHSLSVRDSLARMHPTNAELRRDAGIAHEKVGLTYQQQGRLEEARAELLIAHERYVELAEADLQNVNAQITLAVGEMQLGALMASPDLPAFGDVAAARAHYRRALEILQTVLAIDSSSVRVQELIVEANEALQRL